MDYPAFYKGKWYIWKPLPGLDPSIGQSCMWLAAVQYSVCKSQGKSEAECHSEAEQAAFRCCYRIKY
jgi:hypothetical protein